MNECSSRKVQEECLTGVLVHICHPSMQEAEAKGRSSWQTFATEQTQGQPVLHKRLSPKIKNKCFLLAFRFSHFMSVLWLHLFLCAMYIPSACSGQKRALDSLELELWMLRTTIPIMGARPTTSARVTSVFIAGLSLQHLDFFYL